MRSQALILGVARWCFRVCMSEREVFFFKFLIQLIRVSLWRFSPPSLYLPFLLLLFMEPTLPFPSDPQGEGRI